MELGDFKSGAHSFQKAFRMSKDVKVGAMLSRVMVAEGLLRLEENEYAQAVYCFGEALEADPNNIFAMLQK